MVSVKNPREIELIRESGRIVYETLSMLKENIHAGAMELKLDKLAEEFIRSQSAEPAFKGYLGYPTTLCISVNDEVVHGVPSKRTLKEGDIVSIDCGVLKDGYFGDGAYTYLIGDVSEEVKKLVEVTEKALYIGIKQAKSGNHVSDIGHAIQSYAESYGYSIVRELVGHGIGAQLHEDPQVPNYGPRGQGIRLKKGMCLAIEPMVNLGTQEIYTKEDGWTICTRDGKPSAHFEHTVVVTEGGGKVLSNGERDLSLLMEDDYFGLTDDKAETHSN